MPVPQLYESKIDYGLITQIPRMRREGQIAGQQQQLYRQGQKTYRQEQEDIAAKREAVSSVYGSQQGMYETELKREQEGRERTKQKEDQEFLKNAAELALSDPVGAADATNQRFGTSWRHNKTLSEQSDGIVFEDKKNLMHKTILRGGRLEEYTFKHKLGAEEAKTERTFKATESARERASREKIAGIRARSAKTGKPRTLDAMSYQELETRRNKISLQLNTATSKEDLIEYAGELGIALNELFKRKPTPELEDVKLFLGDAVDRITTEMESRPEGKKPAGYKPLATDQQAIQRFNESSDEQKASWMQNPELAGFMEHYKGQLSLPSRGAARGY